MFYCAINRWIAADSGTSSGRKKPQTFKDCSEFGLSVNKIHLSGHIKNSRSSRERVRIIVKVSQLHLLDDTAAH